MRVHQRGRGAAHEPGRPGDRAHKLAFRVLLHLAARDAGVVDPETFADRLMLLVEGAIVTAYVEGDEFAAARARSAAAALLECAGCA